jgi:D-alanyl-D-alanine carboxypeptidase (penicillin-binding protein 5/6)
MPRALARFSVALVTAAVASATVAVPASADTATGGAIGGEALATKGTVVKLGTCGTPLPKLPDAGSFVLADLDGGQVLAAKNPHGTFLPASTLKVLTALTLIPKIGLKTKIEPTYDDTAVDGSRVGVVEHMKYSADDLFRAMLMVSGNDAALTLTHAVGGPAAAIRMMNDEAKQLQANDTVAKTVNGLDQNGQVTSAYDLALFGRAAMQLPTFQTYVTQRMAKFPAPAKKKGGTTTSFQIFTHDHLLLNYPGAIGIKNGYTVAAHSTFIGAAQRNGHRLIVTLMRDQPLAWKDAAALLDWGFANQACALPVGILVDRVQAGAAVTTDSGATVGPGAGASAAPQAAPAAESLVPVLGGRSSTGLVALIGGIGGGVLLAAIVALAAARRRRIDFPLPADVPVAERVPRARRGRRDPAEEIAVPVAAEPTYTSNIRVRRD